MVRLRPFWRAKRGGIAVYSAIAGPVLLVLAGGAMDITSVTSERNRLRSMAEGGAALAGASDLALASDRDQFQPERAKGWAESEIAEWDHAPEATVTAEIVSMNQNESGVRIYDQCEPRLHFRPAAAARGLEYQRRSDCRFRRPHAALRHRHPRQRRQGHQYQGYRTHPRAKLHGAFQPRHHRQEPGGAIDAGYVQAVHRVNGNVNPGGSTGAQSIPDPFASIDLNPPSCNYTAEVEYSSGTHTLPAGVHCAKIKVRGTAVLRLAPGEHWFVNADLEVRKRMRAWKA